MCDTDCNPDASAPGLATLGGWVRPGKQQSTAKHRKAGRPISFRREAVICRADGGVQESPNPSGKVWADRFELDEFPGVAALVAKVLGVPVAGVEIQSSRKAS